MVERVHRIDSLPDDAPWAGGGPPPGAEPRSAAVRALDRALAVQRPAVVAHLRSIRLRHPTATTSEIVRMLENRYLAAVTTGGAAVGATAVVPGIGTSVTLALSGVETVAFLEATALFAQSIAEVHGIPVADPDRARALVLALMLGQEGVNLVAQLARQATGRGPGRDVYWGELVTKTIPRTAIGPLLDQLTTTFVRHFAARGGASWLGKALPFGIGAAIGGAGNHVFGRRVVVASRRAFGIPPLDLPLELEPRPGADRLERMAWSGARRAGGAIAGTAARGAQRTAGAIGSAARGARSLVTRRGSAPDALPPTDTADGESASEPDSAR